MRISTLVIVLALASATLVAQDGWKQEGSLKRWSGPSISSSLLGCQGAGGAPVVEHGTTIREIQLEGNTSDTKEKPGDEWIFLPRVPNVVAKISHGIEGGGSTTVTFHDVWLNSQIAEMVVPGSNEQLGLDVTDTWLAADGSQGCVVFSPTSNTPEEAEEYVFSFFSNNSTTFTQRVKPKVDVDLYVRPHLDHGVVAYLRGNGISFPPSDEELFTNAGYLVYQPDGTRETMSLPSRGPGSGKGRRIIWHSNKWDRLLMVDEFASGALLIKASNGIVVDSITKSKEDPGQVKILSASGNNNDRWMATHMNVGDKNLITLWAMPDTREVISVNFGSGDNATKQMPLSPWSVVIPFISSNGGNNQLFSWNPQDVVSVDESNLPDLTPHKCNRMATVVPNPAQSSLRVDVSGLEGAVRYVVVDAMGSNVLQGTASVINGSLPLEVVDLDQGSYSVMVVGTTEAPHQKRKRPTRARFVISR